MVGQRGDVRNGGDAGAAGHFHRCSARRLAARRQRRLPRPKAVSAARRIPQRALRADRADSDRRHARKRWRRGRKRDSDSHERWDGVGRSDSQRRRWERRIPGRRDRRRRRGQQRGLRDLFGRKHGQRDGDRRGRPRGEPLWLRGQRGDGQGVRCFAGYWRREFFGERWRDRRKRGSFRQRLRWRGRRRRVCLGHLLHQVWLGIRDRGGGRRRGRPQ